MPTPRKSSITAHIEQRRISRERVLFRRRLTTRSPARSLPSKRPIPRTRHRVRHPERRHQPPRKRHSTADRTRAKARDYISDMEPTNVVVALARVLYERAHVRQRRDRAAAQDRRKVPARPSGDGSHSAQPPFTPAAPSKAKLSPQAFGKQADSDRTSEKQKSAFDRR